MRKLRTAVLAGAAALSVAGTAMAASKDSHAMNLALPDRSVARIEYRGEAPSVRVDPTLSFVPIRFADTFAGAPFAMFDQIFAAIDRQAATMLHQVELLQPQSSGIEVRPDLAAFGAMPAGTVSYHFVSSSDGKHVCSKSWQVTSQGPGQQPKLISASSGDCGEVGAAAVPPAGKTTAKALTLPGEAQATDATRITA